MRKRAHNSTWTEGVTLRGRKFSGPADLYWQVEPRPRVGLATFTARLNRLRGSSELSDPLVEEALYSSASEYRAKYGVRKTWIEVDGRREPLEEIYFSAESRARVPYRNFWQRVRRLQKSEGLDSQSLEDALTLSPEDWRSFYGGGRHRPFQYSGDEYPEHAGRTFHSHAAFLKTIGRYENRATVWSRLKAGWDLDSALFEDVVNEVDRKGIIYRITRLRTGQVYVGLTILSLEGRWRHHLQTARKGATSQLAVAIREDGSMGFEREVLEGGIEGSAALKERERFWVAKLGALGPGGLNTAAPGGLGLRRGKKTEIDGETFHSMKEAAEKIGKRSRLASHVVLSRIQAGRPLPEKARTQSRHPKAGSWLFRIWLSMKRRHPASVEDPWLTDFDGFERDVMPSHSPGHSLVRRDEARSWGPANFEWVSAEEKVIRTHGRSVVIGERTYRTLKEAASAHGLGVSTLKYRLAKGMSPEEAVAAPLGETSFRRSSGKAVVDGITFRSKRQAILHIKNSRGLSEGQAKYRLETGKID